MFSSFIRFVACISTSIVFMDEQYSILYTHHNIHSSVGGNVSCIFAIVNSAARNILCRHLFEYLCSILLGLYLGVELPGRVVTLTDWIQSSCTVYYSHQPCTGFPGGA